jgi:ubiquinone/menaquinone biosynthesis C-methylase UbiE
MLDLISVGFYTRFIKNAVNKMELKIGDSILDLGSGTGKNDLFLAEKIGNEGKILGIDISEEMIKIAEKSCRRYPLIKFRKSRIDEPIGIKNEFDKVFICFVLHGFEDNKKSRIINNAYEALKQGGTFYILDYNEFDLEKMWLPARWVFDYGECELAAEFLNYDLKKVLKDQGFTKIKEEYFFKKYIRLLQATKQ